VSFRITSVCVCRAERCRCPRGRHRFFFIAALRGEYGP